MSSCVEPEIERPSTPVSCPADVPAARAFDARTILGLSEEKARAVTERNGCVLYVARRDGEGFGTTAEYNPRRLHVVVEENVITQVTGVN